PSGTLFRRPGPPDQPPPVPALHARPPPAPPAGPEWVRGRAPERAPPVPGPVRPPGGPERVPPVGPCSAAGSADRPPPVPALPARAPGPARRAPAPPAGPAGPGGAAPDGVPPGPPGPQECRARRGPGGGTVTLEGVAVVDVSEELKSLSSTMESIEAVLDLDRIRADIAVLEEQAAAPSLWDNPDEAQKITSKLSHLQAEVRKAETLRGRIDDLAVLFEMAEEENDPDTRAEAESELESVRKALDEMEVRTLLSGEYDAREALVNIRAEAGGV